MTRYKRTHSVKVRRSFIGFVIVATVILIGAVPSVGSVDAKNLSKNDSAYSHKLAGSTDTEPKVDTAVESSPGSTPSSQPSQTNVASSSAPIGSVSGPATGLASIALGEQALNIDNISEATGTIIDAPGDNGMSPGQCKVNSYQLKKDGSGRTQWASGPDQDSGSLPTFSGTTSGYAIAGDASAYALEVDSGNGGLKAIEYYKKSDGKVYSLNNTSLPKPSYIGDSSKAEEISPMAFNAGGVDKSGKYYFGGVQWAKYQDGTNPEKFYAVFDLVYYTWNGSKIEGPFTARLPLDSVVDRLDPTVSIKSDLTFDADGAMYVLLGVSGQSSPLARAQFIRVTALNGGHEPTARNLTPELAIPRLGSVAQTFAFTERFDGEGKSHLYLALTDAESTKEYSISNFSDRWLLSFEAEGAPSGAEVDISSCAVPQGKRPEAQPGPADAAQPSPNVQKPYADPPANSPHLKLVANVSGGTATPQDFVLMAVPAFSSTGAPVLFGRSGTPGAEGSVDPDLYSLDAINTSGSSEYEAQWSCVGAGGFQRPDGIVSVSSSDTAVTCTVTQKYVGDPRLTLVKKVDGGEAKAGEWTLTATLLGGDGSPALEGQSGKTGEVSEGAYVLEESPDRTDYERGSWECVGTPGSPPVITNPGGAGSLVTLAKGQVATCTVTNTYVGKPYVTLAKKVIGGPATPGDWEMSALKFDLSDPDPVLFKGQAGTPEASGYLEPGDASTGGYWVTATGPGKSEGYEPAQVEWECVGLQEWLSDDDYNRAFIHLLKGVDHQVTCTSTSIYVKPHLKLENRVVGGPASVDDWTLKADGDTPLVGKSGTEGDVNQDLYVLSANGDPSKDYIKDYEAKWECVGTPDPPAFDGDSVLQLEEGIGQTVTCTVTHTYSGPARLKLVKEVVGGTDAPTDWILGATPLSPNGGQHPTLSGKTGSNDVDQDVGLAAGSTDLVTYTLSESGGPSDYAGMWNCVGASYFDRRIPAVQIASTDHQVTCTVVNTKMPKVKLIKEVDGGTATADQWILSAAAVYGGDVPINGKTGTADVDKRVPEGLYTLAETPDNFPGASDYNGSWVCTGASSFDPNTRRLLVLGGDDVTCTVTNTYDPVLTGQSLTLIKRVNGGAATAGEWTLSATPVFGGTPIIGKNGVSGPARPGELYALDESSGPADYEGTWACDGNEASFDPTRNLVSLKSQVNVTCTLTNTYVPPAGESTLTLIKEVNGGAATAGEWTLSATPVFGGTPIIGKNGVSGPAQPGELYALDESSGPADYEGTWACDGNEASFDPDTKTVSLKDGVSVTCTLTNTYVPPVAKPKLTLQKEVVGGSADRNDWTLTATDVNETVPKISGHSTVSPLAEGVVDADTFYLLEESSGPDGYTGEWSCDGNEASFDADINVVALKPGVDVVCTVTNTYTSAKLTLKKEVVGGSADPNDWTLTATDLNETVPKISGHSTVSPLAEGVVDTDSFYLLDESSGPDGYTGEWSCDGNEASFDADTNVVALKPGVDVVCTVTNTYTRAKLTLEKIVAGGSADPDDWTLTATRLTETVPEISGHTTDKTPPKAEGDVETNVPYVLGENGGPGGYTAGMWSCTSGAAAFDPALGVVTLAVGQAVKCTITNTYNGPAKALVQWNKVETGKNANLLSNSEWKLVYPDKTTSKSVKDCVAAVSTDCNDKDYDSDPIAGRFEVRDLDPGEYELYETVAPAGFVADAGPHKFTIQPGDTTVRIPDIENKRLDLPDIPLTGGMGRDYFILGGIILLAVAGGLLLWSRRKRRDV